MKKNILFGSGIFILVLLSFIELVNVVPRIKYDSSSINKKIINNTIIDNSRINNIGMDNNEIQLGDCKPYVAEIPKDGRKTWYPKDDLSIKCSSTNQEILSNCGSIDTENYGCCVCTTTYTYNVTVTMDSDNPDFSKMKLTKGDENTGLEYKATCSVTSEPPGAIPMPACSFSSKSTSKVSSEYAVPVAYPNLEYGCSASIDGGESVNCVAGTAITCNRGWTSGVGRRFFRSLISHQEAVLNGGNLYMEGCTEWTNWCSETRDGKCVAHYYVCDSGQWFTRCETMPESVGEHVCVYSSSIKGYESEFKYADNYNFTNQVSENSHVATVSRDECAGCFGNAPTYARSTETKWATSATADDGTTWYKLDEISRVQDENGVWRCPIIAEPSVCEPIDMPGGEQGTETDDCDDKKTIYYVDGRWCGDNNNSITGLSGGPSFSPNAQPFYEIKCINKFENIFDLAGEDILLQKSGASLAYLQFKQGTSFDYEIKSVGSKVCVAKFYYDTWKSVYNLLHQKLTTNENALRVGEDEIKKVRIWYARILQETIKQVKDYMNWTPSTKNTPGASINLSDSNDAKITLNGNSSGTGASDVALEYKTCADGVIGKIVKSKDAENNEIMTCVPRCQFNGSDPDNCYPKYSKVYTTDYNFDSEIKNVMNSMLNDNSFTEVERMVIEDNYKIGMGKNLDHLSSSNKVSFNTDFLDDVYVKNSGPHVEGNALPKELENLGDEDLKDYFSKVQNYLLYTVEPDEITLIPPKVTLNKINGSIVTSGTIPATGIVEYNRIYPDEKIEKGKKYKIEAVINDIANSRTKISNVSCGLDVVNSELVYRVFDKSNPFINNERDKGLNWYRTGLDGISYDFTKVAGEDSSLKNNYRKEVSFDGNTASEIKRSNASYTDAYLGACYYGVDQTSSVCSILGK